MRLGVLDLIVTVSRPKGPKDQVWTFEHSAMFAAFVLRRLNPIWPRNVHGTSYMANFKVAEAIVNDKLTRSPLTAILRLEWSIPMAAKSCSTEGALVSGRALNYRRGVRSTPGRLHKI